MKMVLHSTLNQLFLIKSGLFSFLLTVLLSMSFIGQTFSQNTYVPDDNFEQALIDLGYDTGVPNDSVPTSNIDTVTILDISFKSITDITKIFLKIRIVKLLT